MQVIAEGLSRLGHDVSSCNVPLHAGTESRVAALRRPALVPLLAAQVAACWGRLARAARRAGEPDVVLVGYAGHVDVLLARRLWPQVPLVLDHLAPAAGIARDRALHAGGREALLAHVDKLAVSAADLALVDTWEHLRALADDDRHRGLVVPVGASDIWFRNRVATTSTNTRIEERPLGVVFFGTFTPLHGSPVIARAIRLLAGRSDIRFTLVGSGQDHAQVRDIIGAEAPVTWLRWLEMPVLARLVAANDVCLGIFGVTEKAHQVVPMKVYQGAAAGCAVVTSDTPPQRRAFGEDIARVPAGDPTALAGYLEALAEDPALLHSARRQAMDRAECFRPEQVVLPLHRRLSGALPGLPMLRGG